MNNLKEIYFPIDKELSVVELELKNQINSIIINKKIINYFFKISGKRLRPALVLLSSKNYNSNQQVIALATAVELIHSASLIHDDIIDNSELRREQLTLNKKFGNQIAVLIGDIFYSKAFSLLTKIGNSKVLDIICQTTQKMCLGEIEEIKKNKISTSKYLEIIKNKTALFMSACCQCGAILADADKKIINILTNYGFNFGILYQIIDDYRDKEFYCNKKKLQNLLNFYIEKTKKSILKFPNSNIKNSFSKLVDFIIQDINEFVEYNRNSPRKYTKKLH